ncbi:hypothetical protein L0F63_003955, partial [Massospora cicadina]
STKDQKFVSESQPSILKGEENFNRTGSSFGAYINVVCVVAGSGTLGIPIAFSQGGWISIGFLISRLDLSSDERLHSYPEIGEAAFGRAGKRVVQFFHYSTLLGVSCMYLVLVGMNMVSASDILKFTLIGIREWVAIGAAAIIIPLVLLRTLKEVAWLSLLGALATLYVVIITVVVGLKDVPRQLELRNAPLSSGWQLINWADFPSSLATISFSFGGNVIYPHVESSMRQPKQWTRVLAAAMATIASMYGLIGVVGYYVYGDTVKSPIMESLPAGGESLSALIVITLHVILVLPITLCSFSLEAESKLGLNIFIIPVVCHLKLFGHRNRPTLEYLWILIVLAVAFLGCFVGTIWAIRDLREAVSAS